MRRIPFAAVIGIFSVAASTNALLATIIAHSKCNNETCSEATQLCLGEGSCQWCYSTCDDKGFCGAALLQSCSGGETMVCGITVPGTCLYGFCTGTSGSGDCDAIRCTPPPPPPPQQ